MDCSFSMIQSKESDFAQDRINTRYDDGYSQAKWNQ